MTSRLHRTVLFTVALVGAGTMYAAAQNSPAPERATPVLHTRPAEPDYKSDPKFQKAVAQAQDRRQTWDDRLADWKHANKIARNQCVDCLHQMIFLQMHQGQWKDAIASATQLDTISSEPLEKAFAEGERGISLLHSNNGHLKPDDLKLAEDSLRSALVIAPHTRQFVYDHGRVLAMMGKDAEARDAFQKYVDIVGASDRYRMRAEHFVDNPHLAAMQMAPPFTLTTSDGRQMQLDDMGGKVVLLDFWATWCGPCKESLPEIARIVKDYANDPMLVVISVSQDADAKAWAAFIQQNNMTWPQYRDADHALGSSYGVSGIPHFFTIDTNGLLKTEQVGSNADVRRVVTDLVKKAHKIESEKAKASEKSSGE